MDKVYANLIKQKAKTIDDVREKLKAEVLEILNAQGLDGYGEPLE